MVFERVRLEFWQRLLAAEAAPLRARAAVSACLRSPDPVRSLLSGNLLAPAELERAKKAKVDPVFALADRGVTILEKAKMPEPFASVSESPEALFCWGDPGCLQRPMIGIVGTRAATTYGKAAAQKFGEAFARAGITVVSGGALGIDGAAHKGALGAGGLTVAVLLTGIERIYPRVHHGLFEEIKKHGCLLSQFAVETSSSKDYRPLLRNQVVAALSSALVVVEAPERSGALSTASAANEMGRHVFVVPSNIENLNFRGSHSLIRDGAILVDHPDQVLEALEIAPVQVAPLSNESLTPIQKKIVSVLSTAPLAGEFIVQRTGLETSVVLSELTMLELEGRIMKDAGGYALRL